MNTINRSVAIVKPKQAYIDWANSFQDEAENYTIEFFRKDCNVYLLNEAEEIGDEAKEINRVYRVIFEEELSSWIVDESVWPKERDFDTFLDWFDVETHSIIIDLGNTEFELTAL